MLFHKIYHSQNDHVIVHTSYMKVLQIFKDSLFFKLNVSFNRSLWVADVSLRMWSTEQT